MTANGHALYCRTVGDCISINELHIDFATKLPPEYAACFLNPRTQPDSLKCILFSGNKKWTLNHTEEVLALKGWGIINAITTDRCNKQCRSHGYGFKNLFFSHTHSSLVILSFNSLKISNVSQNILLLRRLVQILAATHICYTHLFTAQFKV